MTSLCRLFQQPFQSRFGVSVAAQGFHKGSPRVLQVLNPRGIGATATVWFQSHGHALGER